MDPNAAWKLVNDESVELDERKAAADELVNWIDNGGFLPDTGLHPSTLIRHLEQFAARGEFPGALP